MNLQLRALLIPVLTILVLTVGLYVFITQVTLESFNQLERVSLNRAVLRIENAFQNAVEEHALKLVDWAQWDNTYTFMSDQNAAYVAANLNALTMTALNYRTVLFFNPGGDLFYGATALESGETAEAAPKLVSEIRSLIADHPGDYSGFFALQGDSFMFASHEIFPNSGQGGSRGRLVAIAAVDDAMFQRIAYETNLTVSFSRTHLSSPNKNSRANTVNDIDIIDYSLATAHAVIRDVKGEPIVHFRIDDNRKIVQAGEGVRRFALVGLTVAGTLAATMLVLIIRVTAVRRIERLIEQIAAIAGSRNDRKRLCDFNAQSGSLRYRTAGGVLLVFALMSVVGGLVFSQYFLSGFEVVEDQLMHDNLTRASRALEARLDKIKGKTIDWAQWDDTFNYVEELNTEYEESNLGFDTLGPMGVRFVLYLGMDGSLRKGVEVSANEQVVRPVSQEVQSEIQASADLFTAAEPRAGFIRLADNVYLIAISPILDTARAEQPRGVMLFAVPVDESLTEELARQVQLDLAFLPEVQVEGVEDLSSEIVSGRRLIRDLTGNPILTIRVNSPRSVYKQGVLASRSIPLYFILGGVLCAFVTVYAVDRILVSRFRSITEGVAEIQESRDLSHRVEKKGKDEIATLADQINSMLTSLEEARLEVELARDEAEAANSAKSSFIAKVSHELRTPIHGVVGMLRILLKEEQSKSKREYIRMARDSAYGLLETINEILDFSKMESGNLSLEKIDFSLRTVIRDTLRTVAPRAEEKGTVEVINDIQAQVPDSLIGDPLRIKQILTNLLGNSIKFTKEGFVKLEVDWNKTIGEAGFLVIRVIDSGIGISADRLPRIFEPFTQADDTISRVYTGTGLGLTIVKQLVEQMGGKVRVDSELGRGTTFALSIPISRVAGSDLIQPQIKLSPSRVAIIDGTSHLTVAINDGFDRYGLKSEIVDSSNEETLGYLSRNVDDFGLVVVMSSALKRSRVFNLVVDLTASRRVPIVTILSPFELSVRERLTALDVPYIVSRPISVEDILLTVSGQLAADVEAWEGDDEILLTTNRQLNVLIADDAHTNRIILTSMLEEAGHKVTCVENGLDLVAQLQGQLNNEVGVSPFDIVLTDVQMPIMDGISATREVRSREARLGRETHIPIVAVTAHAMTEEKKKMRESGVDDVVTKPIEPAELAKVLQRLTGADRLTATAESRASLPNTSGETAPLKSELDNLKDTTLRTWRQLDVGSDNDCGLSSLRIEEVLDIADVYRRSGDSARRTRMILKAFYTSFKEQVTRLARAKGLEDWAELQSAAHALKGLLLDVGARTSGALASLVESGCKDGQGPEAAAKVTELISQILLVARLVERIVESSDPAQKSERLADSVFANVGRPGSPSS